MSVKRGQVNINTLSPTESTTGTTTIHTTVLAGLQKNAYSNSYSIDFYRISIYNRNMTISEIKKLKDKVEYCLREHPETRNSDIRLTHQIWATFHPRDLLRVNGQWMVSLKAMYELPREDNVKRVRAKFQNEENKYLPTDLDIALKRGILEDVWREAMGYKVRKG